MMTPKQNHFIEGQLRCLLTFLKGRDRKIKTENFEIFCENVKDKTLVGLDFNYSGNKKKGFELVLFWGRYESIKTDDDKLIAIDNDTTVDKIVELNKETEISNIIEIFNKGLKEL